MKIKNRRWHKKRYLENKMNDFIFVHDKRPHSTKGFNWINGTNIKSIQNLKFSPTFTSKEDMQKNYELELQKL